MISWGAFPKPSTNAQPWPRPASFWLQPYPCDKVLPTLLTRPWVLHCCIMTERSCNKSSIEHSGHRTHVFRGKDIYYALKSVDHCRSRDVAAHTSGGPGLCCVHWHWSLDWETCPGLSKVLEAYQIPFKCGRDFMSDWFILLLVGSSFYSPNKHAPRQPSLHYIDRNKPRSKVVVDVRVHKTLRYNTTWDNHKFLSTWDSQQSQVLLTLARVSNVALYFRGKLSRFVGVGILISSVHGSPFCLGENASKEWFW